MILRTAPLAAVCLLAACAPDHPEADDPAGAAAERTEEAAVPAQKKGSATRTSDGSEADGRAYHFTSLENCPIVREERAEMPFVERRCEGLGGYDLKITDSDARNNLIVVAPDGRETSLELSRIGGGGFSSLGNTAEWRGPSGAETFTPDSLIVRYQVAEQPHPAPEMSYLLTVRLSGEPCVTAQVPPGPEQNERARRQADRAGSCLAG